MDAVDVEWVWEILRGINDPELGSSIVELGMVRSVQWSETGTVQVEVALTTVGCPLKHEIRATVRGALERDARVSAAVVDFAVMGEAERGALMRTARAIAADRDQAMNIARRTQVIAVSSGKGGVGKSTVTAHMAVALAMRGRSVGVLDADIWGYSIPRIFGMAGTKLEATGDAQRWSIEPLKVAIGEGALSVVSMGMLAKDEESAIMWRGPMLSRALQHFVEDVLWGDLDYLLVDMPPGTGDIQMTMARLLPQCEVIVVTTPAAGASRVAQRVGDMSEKANLGVIGVVENMAYLDAPSGERLYPYGQGGGADVAEALGVPLLAQIPLLPELSDESLILRRIEAHSTDASIEEEGSITTLARYLDERGARESEAMSGCSARMMESIERALAERDQSNADERSA